jgi:hypothetical protein
MSEFRSTVGVSGFEADESRRARYFGLAYAAGCLAVEYSVLPVSRRDIRRAVVDVFRRHCEEEDRAQSAHDPVRAIESRVRALTSELLDLRGRESPPTEGEIEAAKGYRVRRHGREELCFTPHQFSKLLPTHLTTNVACNALKKAGLLVADRGGKRSTAKNQTKRRIGTKRHRVYCVSASILDEKKR